MKITKEVPKPKELSDKQMRELLLSLKKEADKMPEEEGSFGIEVICSGNEIEKNRSKKK